MKKFSGKASSIKRTSSRAIGSKLKFSSDLVKALPRSEMAAKIAGTSDKKSKPYKAALRNLQRYAKGRTPKKAAREKVERAAKAIIKKEPDLIAKIAPSGTITVSGLIGYSDDVRDRTIEVDMDSDQMAEYFESNDPFDQETRIFSAYGVPGMYIADRQRTLVAIEFDA
jgi:hypothetical protein